MTDHDKAILRELSTACDLIAQAAGYMASELTMRLGGGDRPGFFFEDGMGFYREAGVHLERFRELTKE
jgi:hypothetical protein